MVNTTQPLTTMTSRHKKMESTHPTATARILALVLTTIALNSYGAGSGSVFVPAGLFQPELEITSAEEVIRWQLNRGRFDAAAENAARGTRFSDVPASTGPLVPNNMLRSAAVNHSMDMHRTGRFQHATIPGSYHYDFRTQPRASDRIRAEGYTNYLSVVENIAFGYHSAKDAYLGWWLSRKGHRPAMYAEGRRDVGIGISVSFYTMDMGRTWDAPRAFTGTLFHDVNANGEYDVGEGLDGIEVSVQAASGPAFKASSRTNPAGAFVISLNLDPNRKLTVSLYNSRDSDVVVTVPRSYSEHEVFTLPSRSLTLIGTLETVAEGNLGLRNLTAVDSRSQREAPELSIAIDRSTNMVTLRWQAVRGKRHKLQRSERFSVWKDVLPGKGHFTVQGDLAVYREGLAGNPGGYFRLVEAE